MKFDGFKEALELLKNLDTKSRLRILEEMAKKDPNLVERLKSQMVTFNDFIYLTPMMLKDVLDVIDPQTLGIALRTEDSSIAEKLGSMMSKNNASELDAGRNEGLKSLAEVQKIQNEVLDIVNKLVDQGKVILSKEGDEYI